MSAIRTHTAPDDVPVNHLVEIQLLVVSRVDLVQKLFELGPRSFCVQRFFRRLSEYLREEVWYEAAENQVGIGHRQRTAFPDEQTG